MTILYIFYNTFQLIFNTTRMSHLKTFFYVLFPSELGYFVIRSASCPVEVPVLRTDHLLRFHVQSKP